MRKSLILLPLISTMAMAQTTTDPDPLTQILDKLESIEKRLDDLENDGAAATPAPSPDNNTQNANAAPQSTTNPPKDELTGGMIVKIKNVDDSKDHWFTTGVNEEHFAGFVNKGATLTTTQIQDESLGYTGAYAIVIEGFLNAKETGLYNLGVLHEQPNAQDSFSSGTECMTSINLNGTQLGQLTQEAVKTPKKEKNMLVSGSVSLEKGLYEYSIFSVCNDHIIHTGLGSHNKAINRTLLIKAPNDLSMRPIETDDILHKK